MRRRVHHGATAGWSNAKHRQQWTNTLRDYVSPALGRLPVAAIDTDLVVKVLQPIWEKKPETASRVRGRIEAVLDWATAKKLRQGDNPARWQGNLEHLLSERSRAVEHLAALPYAEIGAFLAELRRRDGVAARALEFTILTAARSGEVLGARWDEIDMRARLWTVPAAPHEGAAASTASRYRRPPWPCWSAWRGCARARSCSPAISAPSCPITSMLAILKRMGRDDLTVHGFRSSFRDWAAERTNFPNEMLEMALAHTVSDKVEAAYRRGDMFDKRRKLMDAWAEYCAKPAAPTGEVVPLRARAKERANADDLSA